MFRHSDRDLWRVQGEFTLSKYFALFSVNNVSLTLIIEFSLNDFLSIQRIQWIMTKSRDILYLTADVAVKKNFHYCL